MTTNAFIFSWDCEGIEAIISISEYERVDMENTIRILKEQQTKINPLDGIIQRLVFRAKFNSQRHYEIYAVDCADSMDKAFWKKQWEEFPQETAELIRERGHKLYSDRKTTKDLIV
jgi:hypothetical protein